MNIDPGNTLDGVSRQTRRCDNTRVERLKALIVLKRECASAEEFAEFKAMLGIEDEWVLTEDPKPERAEPKGFHHRRNMYNGPARL